jgi:Dyp-type peroxidase family
VGEAAVNTRRHQVDQGDLQGNVLTGYGTCYRDARYLFLRVRDASGGRRWLRDLADEVTTARPHGGNRPAHTLNVALTHGGLQALGVPPAVLQTFPPEFVKGMECQAGKLGDTGESAPGKWEPDLRSGATDALVTVMAQGPDHLTEATREVLDTARADGLECLYEQRCELLGRPPDYSREHFGFADGFSQPSIRGNAGPSTRDGMGTPLKSGKWADVAPGEFVLGYPGEDGLLEPAPAAPLGRSGSFMVVRKLRQHVDRFNAYLAKQAERDLPFLRHLGDDARARRDELAAKIVGRRLDGTSLRHPDTDECRAKERINNFRYGPDEFGYGCPLGAHVRRANPRDALGWAGQLVKRHRIIRRGMPYGKPGDEDCGLMFICYQASIARQFELIQSRWLNDGDAFWLGGEKDLLTMGGSSSDPDDPDAHMTVQGEPPSFLAPPEKPLVTTRGGDYFFTPGLSALRALGSAYWR